MSSKTDKILSGENIEIQFSGIEEIDDMSRNFNIMTEKLRELYEKLKNDISHREQIQSELEESKQLAELANQAKSDFLSNMSHELRTPLTVIHGSVKLLLNKSVDDPVKADNLLKIADNNCQKLIALVNDVLDLTKIEQGKLDFIIAPVELVSVLEESVDINLAYAKQLNVKLDLKYYDFDKTIRVNVDKNRLIQVLRNLISNAVKFSPANDEVVISVEKINDRARVNIIDNGPGIPQELQKNIFQRFYQVDSSITRKTGGTGLGLNISKSIIEQLDGSIGFEIEKNTIFYFELPIF